MYCSKWLKLLKYHSINDYFYITQDVLETDQVYVYSFEIYNVPFNLSFLIPYIRRMYQIDSNLFRKCNMSVKDGLRFNNEICKYNHYENSAQTEYGNEIANTFFTCIYTKKPTYVVLDGNHRISQQVNNGVNEIISNYCPSEIAARSLISSFQASVYVFLEDCYKMLSMKGSENYIKRNLSIFNSDSFINNIEKRNNKKTEPSFLAL